MFGPLFFAAFCLGGLFLGIVRHHWSAGLGMIMGGALVWAASFMFQGSERGNSH